MALLDQPDAADGSEPGATLGFTCPRCQAAVDERYYGPCTSCRVALRATYAGLARHVEQEDYVPKLNVTPTAVATKE